MPEAELDDFLDVSLSSLCALAEIFERLNVPESTPEKVVSASDALMASNADERDCLGLTGLEAYSCASCDVETFPQGEIAVERELLVRL